MPKPPLKRFATLVFGLGSFLLVGCNHQATYSSGECIQDIRDGVVWRINSVDGSGQYTAQIFFNNQWGPAVPLDPQLWPEVGIPGQGERDSWVNAKTIPG